MCTPVEFIHKKLGKTIYKRVKLQTTALNTNQQIKIVDLTHYINDNATMVAPLFTKFKLDVIQKGWINLQKGGKAWYVLKSEIYLARKYKNVVAYI